KGSINALIDQTLGPCEVGMLLIFRIYSPKELDLFSSYPFTKLHIRGLAGCVVISSDSIEFGHN
ncbi:22572_t:CDS:1, partial [Gigaspora rosea]